MHGTEVFILIHFRKTFSIAILLVLSMYIEPASAIDCRRVALYMWLHYALYISIEMHSTIYAMDNHKIGKKRKYQTFIFVFIYKNIKNPIKVTYRSKLKWLRSNISKLGHNSVSVYYHVEWGKLCEVPRTSMV